MITSKSEVESFSAFLDGNKCKCLQWAAAQGSTSPSSSKASPRGLWWCWWRRWREKAKRTCDPEWRRAFANRLQSLGSFPPPPDVESRTANGETLVRSDLENLDTALVLWEGLCREGWSFGALGVAVLVIVPVVTVVVVAAAVVAAVVMPVEEKEPLNSN